MDINRVDPVYIRTEIIKNTKSVGRVGKFDLRCDTSSGLDRLKAAIEDVSKSIRGDLESYANAVDFIALCREPLALDELTLGYCVKIFWHDDDRSAILIDSDSITEMTHGDLCFLLAHELRHAWQFATDYSNSSEVQYKLRYCATYQAMERDADDYAQSLGYFKGYSLKAKAWGHPEDASFQTVLKNWMRLTTEQKESLAEFLSMNGTAWKELGVGICNDSRLFTVASLWDSVSDSQRDRITQQVRQAAIPGLETVGNIEPMHV